MTATDERTDTEKTMGCLALLVAIPVCVWIEAHTYHLAWGGILRAYLPTLPVLTLWQSWTMGLAIKVFAMGSGYTFKQDDRPDKKWSGVGRTAASLWRWLLVWLVVRYVVTP